MGEEWGTTRPFPFFCDFSGDLARAVREGRRQEFASFPEFQDPQSRSRIPDPQAESTFHSAKLDWSEPAKSPHADWLRWYQAILRVRRDVLVPRLDEITHGGRYRVLGTSAVSVRWELSQDHLVLDANLSPVPVHGDPCVGNVLWLEGAAKGESLSPWSVRWSVEKS
jgi:maltooligosyltrehalose trehalohydrolase